MTKKLLIIILTALVLAVWSAIIFRDKPVKLDEEGKRESLTPIRKGRG